MPFYIRAGKYLPVTTTEVVVELKRPPQNVFGENEPRPPRTIFRFRLSPDVVIALGARTKVPGEAMVGEDVELIARHAPGGDEMAPYERLLSDAMRGDATLFAREDAIEAAWRVVDPILGNATPIHPYDPGHLGPARGGQIDRPRRRMARSDDGADMMGMYPPPAPPDAGGEYIWCTRADLFGSNANVRFPLPCREGVRGWA